MKTTLLYFLAMLFVLNQVTSQDRQWLVLNGNGKSGYSGGINLYTNTLSLAQFNLTKVSTPNRGAESRARNDLFIIYSDGEHFNSRLTSNTDLFYYGSVPASTIKSHNFNSGTRSPKFMYLANRYEGDDLPADVRVSSGTATGTSTTNLLSTSTPGLLSASHNVVDKREITIIIDYESAMAGNKQEPENNDTLILKFDRLQKISNGQNYMGLDILDLKPVFGSPGTTDLDEAIYPNQTVVSQVEEIVLEPGPDRYRYVNLKPNLNAEVFYVLDTKGEPAFNAIFSLERNGVPLGTHPEKLSFSYDPNYLAVKSITKMPDSSHVITYHLEFENTGEVPEDSLSAQVEFPSMFDINSIKALRWSIGGLPAKGKASLAASPANKMIFVFKEHGQLIKCNQHFPNQGKGFVEFEVNINSSINVEDLSVSLELDNPTAFFSTRGFLIEEFRDLTECNGGRRPIDGITSGQDLSTAPALSANALKCYRPISLHDKCIWWWGIACWIWILIGVLLIILLFWLLIRRRNP